MKTYDKISKSRHSVFLGHRILTKLTNLIRSEMNQIGGQELSLSAVGRKKLWEASDRWNLMHNELFKFKDHKEEYCLSPVCLTPLIPARFHCCSLIAAALFRRMKKRLPS